MSLMKFVVPFVMGKVMGPKSKGPTIVEQALLTYRKVLMLTLISLGCLAVLVTGVIIGTYKLFENHQVTGNWEITSLVGWGLGAAIVGGVGFFLSTKAKTWLQRNQEEKKKQSKESEPLKISEALALLMVDFVEERKAQRYERAQYEMYDESYNPYSQSRAGAQTTQVPNELH